DRVVHRAAVDAVVALHDEHVAAADALGVAGPDLAVRELDDVGVAERLTEMGRHLLRERGVGSPRVEGELLGGDLLHGERPSRDAGWSCWWAVVASVGRSRWSASPRSVE